MESASGTYDGIALEPWEGRAIILLDLDAFFASVEQLDHPEWRGKPVIVGGDADKRGVVATCSYEARKYGVRSAMPSFTAAKLCPDAIWTHGHFDRYRELSKQVMDIIREETPHVQQVSIDEAFADISPTRTNREHPVLVAQRIQSRVAELGVTCSIGVGVSKSVAKIASDMDKPNGLTIIYPGSERAFLKDLPVRTLSGVGAAAERKLEDMGIHTLGEIADADIEALRHVFGIAAEEMQARSMGSDTSEVSTKKEVKSVSHELSYAEDLVTREDIEASLSGLLSKVGRRLRMKGLAGTTLTLKMRFADRSIHTAQTHLTTPSDDEIELKPVLFGMIERLWVPGEKVRLLGVAVSGFKDLQNGQQSIFDQLDGEDADLFGAPESDSSEYAPLIEDAEMRRNLIAAYDKLKDRFGEDAVQFGSALRDIGSTTGTATKHPADM